MFRLAIFRRLRSCRGFSAIETTAILSAVSVLAAVSAPAVEGYLAEARLTRAIGDERVIATSLARLAWDVTARERRMKGWEQRLLAGAGGTPQLGPGGDIRWTLTADGGGSLTDHLVTNDAGYPVDAGERLASGRGWRGPYVDGPVTADPWGFRYAVNARWMALGAAFDTVVLSAGPNGRVETAFERDGLRAGDDDVTTLVWSGG